MPSGGRRRGGHQVQPEGVDGDAARCFPDVSAGSASKRARHGRWGVRWPPPPEDDARGPPCLRGGAWPRRRRWWEAVAVGGRRGFGEGSPSRCSLGSTGRRPPPPATAPRPMRSWASGKLRGERNEEEIRTEYFIRTRNSLVFCFYYHNEQASGCGNHIH